jgi:hypothetical protein
VERERSAMHRYCKLQRQYEGELLKLAKVSQ